jgi:hypothetical protein
MIDLLLQKSEGYEIEELEKNFRKAFAKGLTVLGLLHGAHYIGNQQPTEPSVQKPGIEQQKTDPKQEKINNFLKTTSMIESSGGKNLNHPKIKSGIHAGDRAIGKWALMPNTVKELVGRMGQDPDVSHYKNMDNKQLHAELSKKPEHQEKIVTFLASKLHDKFGGDENKMAYSWNQGHNLTNEHFNTDRKNYMDHDYVKKYNKFKDSTNKQAESKAPKIKTPDNRIASN